MPESMDHETVDGHISAHWSPQLLAGRGTWIEIALRARRRRIGRREGELSPGEGIQRQCHIDDGDLSIDWVRLNVGTRFLRRGRVVDRLSPV